MRYLVTCDGQEPFLTNWFDAENNFNKEVVMVVYDFWQNTYTTDGINWNEIKIDSL